jgi:hypothetical protein
LEPERNIKSEELNHYNASINGIIEDIFEYEDEIREEFQDVVDERVNTESIVKDLKRLIKKHGKSQLS